MTFEEFKKEWKENDTSKKLSGFRKGQSLINLLNHRWKAEYVRISSVHYYDRTDIDCYFNDDLIPNTLKHLEDNWNQYPK